ncbi:MAG: heme exporter protein CcmB [Alphaproteobacteria bacterium]
MIKKLWVPVYLELISQRHLITRPFVFVLMAFVYAFLIQKMPSSVSHAPKVLIMLAILTLLTEIERLFADDCESGRLELWLVERHSLEHIFVRKIIVFWIFGVIPLLAALAVLFTTLNLPFPLAFAASFLLAGITLTTIGSLLSALLLGITRPVILMLLLMLPLMLPEILLTLGAYEQALLGDSVTTLLCLQLGISCISVAVCLLAVPAIVRWSVH